MKQTLQWTKAAPGVWRTTVGEPESLTPLGVAGCAPRVDAMRDLPDGALALPRDGVVAETGGSRVTVCVPLEAREALFGLGLQFAKLNHRGRTRYLRVNSDPRQDTGETHAPVPFYVSSRGYGLLVNSARIVTIHCGSTVRRDSANPPPLRDRSRDPDWSPTPTSDVLEIAVSAPGMELYLFSGPTMLDVVRRYVLFCGGGALPPRWGLGFWHRTHIAATADDVLAEAREYRRRGLPCDVIGLEPGWHTTAYPTSYEWAKDRFPDPETFVSELAGMGFRVNLWENPYVSPRARIHKPLEPLSGSHTVWGGLVPDYTLAEARAILQAQHEEDHLDIGISGYKLDECDGSELTNHAWMFPMHALFPSGHDGEQMRQVYGLLLQALYEEMFRQRDQRTYGLVRASMAGGCALPYVLYSDLYDHRQFIRALCNASFSGLLWTPEVRGASSPEELVRRMQVVCLSPLAQLNAWNTQTKLWSFPEVEHIIRKYLRLRMSLLPYLYSAFARYRFQGVPPFRAMALEIDPETAQRQPELLELDDQYMIGDDLLAAPLLAGESFRQVYLPPGMWYDYETGQPYEGGQMVWVSPGLERMPLFVRDGAIIPTMPARDHLPGPGQSLPLDIRCYGSAPGRFALYDDDGLSYGYERGLCQWRQLETQATADGERRGQASTPRSNAPCTYGEMRWTFIGSELR